jgi:hypothetical protein
VVSNDIINLLIQRASSERTRTSSFSATRPTHWAPREVTCPETGQAFTPAGAWEFVVEKLKNGEPIEMIPMDRPPGAKGYVMKCAGVAGQIIYIKLQLGNDCVFGRSFHLSDR